LTKNLKREKKEEKDTRQIIHQKEDFIDQ